jgi:mRNA interferase RelE/StbE
VQYAFRFTTAAQRRLRALDRTTATRVLKALTTLGDDPHREDADVEKPAGGSGLCRLRAGDYRVAALARDGELTA